MSPQAGWILVNQIVPRLRSAVPQAVRLVGCEDPEELVQDATAMAAKMLHNAEANGKKVTAGNIAYYTIQHMKSGRRSVGHSNADVYGSATQLNARSAMSSFQEEVIEPEDLGDLFTLADALSCGTDDPSTAAARSLDWQEFVNDQPSRIKTIVRFMAEGMPTKEIANECKVSTSTIRNHQERLKSSVREFFGNSILEEVIELPGWKNSLIAQRERIACKLDRR